MKVDKYLTKGELVRKTFSISGYEVQATNKRLFIATLDGKTVQDYMYQHISSMEFTARHYRWSIGVGIAIIGVSIFYKLFTRTPFEFEFDLYWLGIIAGIACIFAGIFLKKDLILLHVIGAPGARTLDGDRKDFDALFRIVREESNVPEKVEVEIEKSS